VSHIPNPGEISHCILIIGKPGAEPGGLRPGRRATEAPWTGGVETGEHR